MYRPPRARPTPACTPAIGAQAWQPRRHPVLEPRARSVSPFQQPTNKGPLMQRLVTQAVQGQFASPLGALHLLASPHGLLGAWFEGQAHFPDLRSYPRQDAHPLIVLACQQLQAYFDKKSTHFSVPLDASAGTPFQKSVWTALQEIAPGQTSSYGALAHTIGQPKAARAVGAAVGRNPWSIIVPCHRVLGAGGALTGYAGGLDRKIALLQLESAI